jgi:diacylglycerol kinase family enzyme
MGVIPVRLDPASALPRNVGLIQHESGGKIASRCFLLNAGLGLPAEVRLAFDGQGGFPSTLRRLNPSFALGSAFLLAIVGHRDQMCTVRAPGIEPSPIPLTSLDILLSPFVFRSFAFPVTRPADEPTLEVVLTSGLGPISRARLVLGLARGTLPHLVGIITRRTTALSVSSRMPFVVEYDGEVISTTNATFSLLPRRLSVCRW